MQRGERFNVLSHLAGIILSAIGLIFLLRPAIQRADLTQAIAFSVYGASLIAVFLTSVLYHWFRGEAKQFWRRFDRSAIYLLIAGTYTPFAVLKLPVSLGAFVLITIWAIAGFGVFSEWTREQRSVALYLVMGWIALPLMPVLISTVGWHSVLYLVAGGLFYTIGSIAVSLTHIPRHHEIWHVFVLLGSGCHFWAILNGA